MERRGQQEMGNNPMGYTSPQSIQESPVKLPLAPILSTPPDHRRPNHAMVSTRRRGCSIFSPTQTLDHQPYIPPPCHQLSPPPQLHKNNDASSDPDPNTPINGDASNSNNPTPPPPQEVVPVAGITHSVRYKECLKNHAANMGAHVVDGCGEFMPSGEEGSPEALKCAACDCHRNFHRKEGDGEPTPTQQPHFYSGSSHRSGQTPAPSAAAPSQHLRHHFAAPSTMVNFGGKNGGAAAESSSEDLNMFQSGGHAAGQPSFSSGSKKRFRTKFRQDQKDQMHEFAMKLGWRIQKHDEHEVQQFCSEVGVKRQVFKVWMHNNKQVMKKRDPSI